MQCVIERFTINKMKSFSFLLYNRSISAIMDPLKLYRTTHMAFSLPFKSKRLLTIVLAWKRAITCFSWWAGPYFGHIREHTESLHWQHSLAPEYWWSWYRNNLLPGWTLDRLCILSERCPFLPVNVHWPSFFLHKNKQEHYSICLCLQKFVFTWRVPY